MKITISIIIILFSLMKLRLSEIIVYSSDPNIDKDINRDG